VAFLWDESYLWGLMAYKGLRALNLPFDLVRAEDLRNGCLNRYRMLFVPGGWASNKLKALGERGIEEIRRFVHDGGNYFGICGGAGLATLDGIGLLNIKRKPTKERVPSFSGRIALNIRDHPVFTPSPIFHAWWPSQFVVLDSSINVIATFGEALPDAFSSDLNVGDVQKNGGWKELERFYGINLDPSRLIDEPAVLEGDYGRGKVLLSLVHFDTLDDRNGAEVLRNIWHYLSATVRQNGRATDIRAEVRQSGSNLLSHGRSNSAALLKEVEELINFGIRNFLWFWRTPMLLQWRRGVRGLEYCTLYVMIREIAELIEMGGEGLEIENSSRRIMGLLMPFIEDARRLLVMERYAMQNGHITYERCDDPKVQEIRKRLFGDSKSHGGMFKDLIDEVDDFLYYLISRDS